MALNWKKVLVSGSNISELVNDAGYLVSAGSNLVSSSAQVTLGGVLTGTADNAAYVTKSISNAEIADNAAIAYSKLDLSGSTILSGSIDLSALVTTASFNSYTSSTDASITALNTSASTAATAIGTLEASASYISDILVWTGSAQTSIDALNTFTGSYSTASLVTKTEFNTYTGSADTAIANAAATASAAQLTADSASAAIVTLSGSVDALNAATSSYVTTTTFTSFTSSYDTFSASVDSFSGSYSTRITNLESSASAAADFSASFESRLTTDEGKYDAYTSSFTTETLIVTGDTAITGTLGVLDNVSFGADLTVEGNFTVNGTASVINSTQVSIADKFITLASGSSTLTDAGIIFQSSAAGAGPALFLEATATGDYGRMAMATSVSSDSLTATPDAYVTTTETGTSLPAAPTFGGTTTGYGNIFVNSSTGDIYIYA